MNDAKWSALKAALEDKERILIWGFGREGKSTCRLLRRLFPERTLWVADDNIVDVSEFDNVEFIHLAENDPHFDCFDLIMKSPGIAVIRDDVPIARLNSQTELFLMLLRDQVVGVTGTKGKSTTSSLLYHIISGVKENTIFCGNIGIPCMDMLDKIDDDTTIVFEMSCHQLEFTDYSPAVSVLLNLHEDHLDHYITYDKYIEAKSHILTYQKPDDFAVVNMADAEYLSTLEKTGERIFVGRDIIIEGRTVTTPLGTITVNESDTQLVGPHNLFNIAVAFYICRRELDISNERFLELLATFSPLPHRLQKVGTFDGVTYYDDSISTICESAITAIKSLGNVGTLLLGGMDRGIDYTELIDALFEIHIDNLVLIGQAAPRLNSLISERSAQTGIEQNIYISSDFADAVSAGKRLTQPGKVCLLSPAAASYDMFRNFEARGDEFARLVREG